MICSIQWRVIGGLWWSAIVGGIGVCQQRGLANNRRVAVFTRVLHLKEKDVNTFYIQCIYICFWQAVLFAATSFLSLRMHSCLSKFDVCPMCMGYV